MKPNRKTKIKGMFLEIERITITYAEHKTYSSGRRSLGTSK